MLKQLVRERDAETQTCVERVTDMQTDRQIRQADGHKDSERDLSLNDKSATFLLPLLSDALFPKS